uniref:Uncharacterized protein n=1 Tax=uncultured bacterium Contig14 TaxID=1393423 RepID=W0FNG8_9BACT|nr:hypothetical protein [uncultured bacterium Contig14]
MKSNKVKNKEKRFLSPFFRRRREKQEKFKQKT